MIDKIKAGLGYIADLYRTAPLGESFFLFGLGTSFVGWNFDQPTILVNGVITCFGGALLTKRQFKLRRRLEEYVSENGYDNRVFEKTIPEWCGRQTARVVARNCGNLDDYVALCEANRERMEYPYLLNL